MPMPDGHHANFETLCREAGVIQLRSHMGWGGRLRWSFGKDGHPGHRHERNGVEPYTWEQLVARHGDAWTRVSVGHACAWIKTRDLPKLLASGQTIRGKKFNTAAGRPCEETITTGGGWESACCGRLAVGTRPDRGWGRELEEPWSVCKMHLNAENKRRENEERWAAQREAADEKRTREQETRARVEEALARCRPILESIGIHPQTLSAGEHGDRIGALMPAEVLELLAEKVAELEALKADVGL